MPGLFVGEDEAELSDVLVLPITLTRNRCCEFCPKMLLWTSQLWKRCEFRSLCHQCSCLSSGLSVTNAPACSLKDLFSDVLRKTHQNSLFSLPTLCHQCSLGWKLKCELKWYQKVCTHWHHAPSIHNELWISLESWLRTEVSNRKCAWSAHFPSFTPWIL
jgi:hypothetical protein